MMTPAVHIVYADYAVGVGDGKYVCIGENVNGQQIIRLHDLAHVDSEGKLYRFVNLNRQQWIDLCEIAPHVIEAVRALADHGYSSDSGFSDDWSETPDARPLVGREQKIHIGNNVCIHFKVGSDFIQVRQNFLPAENVSDLTVDHEAFDIIPTRSGVCYRFSHWEKLVAEISNVNSLLKLKGPLVTCKAKHVTGENGCMKECPHCNPNGYQHWLNEATKETAQEE